MSFVVSIQVCIFPLNMSGIIIYIAQWWEKYLLKRTLIKRTCSWRANLLYYNLEAVNLKNVYMKKLKEKTQAVN